jgi:hypothetical protein
MEQMPPAVPDEHVRAPLAGSPEQRVRSSATDAVLGRVDVVAPALAGGV